MTKSEFNKVFSLYEDINYIKSCVSLYDVSTNIYEEDSMFEESLILREILSSVIISRLQYLQDELYSLSHL